MCWGVTRQGCGFSTGLNCLSSAADTGTFRTRGRGGTPVFALPPGELITTRRAYRRCSAASGIKTVKELAGHLFAGNYIQLKSHLFRGAMRRPRCRCAVPRRSTEHRGSPLLPRISSMPKSAFAISGALRFHETRRSLPRLSTASPSGTFTSARAGVRWRRRRQIAVAPEIQKCRTRRSGSAAT